MSRRHWKHNSAKSVGDSERHFRRRLGERYGIVITSEEYRQLCAAVRNGNATHLFRESLTRTHWLVSVRGTDVRAVYDKTQKALATALPPSAQADRNPKGQDAEERLGAKHESAVAKPGAHPSAQTPGGS